MNTRPTVTNWGRPPAVGSENVKYSFQRSKKFFIPYRIDMEVTPRDLLPRIMQFHINTFF